MFQIQGISGEVEQVVVKAFTPNQYGDEVYILDGVVEDESNKCYLPAGYRPNETVVLRIDWSFVTQIRIYYGEIVWGKNFSTTHNASN